MLAHIGQHRFHDARVACNDVAGQQVVMATGKVADDSACFTGDQLACREIPRLQRDFKVAVNPASGNVGQIQAAEPVRRKSAHSVNMLPRIFM